MRTSRRWTTGCSNAARPSDEHPAPAVNTAAVTTNTSFLIAIPRSPVDSPCPSRRFVFRFAPQLLPPRQPLRNLLLEPERPWLVKARAAQGWRQVLLRDICLRCVVRVLIPRTIPQFLHQTSRRISNVQRNALRRVLACRLEGRTES